MPIEAILVRLPDGSFAGASSHDREELERIKVGQPYRVELVRQSARSLRHHRLYFGGLLGLALDYWEPAGGVLGESEEATVRQFARFLDKNTGGNAVATWADFYLEDLKKARAGKVESLEKSKEALHEWVKIEAGYFDRVETPRGIKRVARSINFNSMSQEDFNDFYKAAFSVVWKFILSRSFESEAEAQAAVDQLVAMG